MSAKEKLFTIYQTLYAQRTVLTEAPALTVDISGLSANTMDYPKVRKEAASIISYLMGVKDIDKVEVKNALMIVEKNYENQPFWKNLILEYLSFANEEEAEQLAIQAQQARAKALEVLQQIQQQLQLEIFYMFKEVKEMKLQVLVQSLVIVQHFMV